MPIVTITSTTEPPCKHENGWNRVVRVKWWLFTFKKKFFFCTDCHNVVEPKSK